MKRILIFLLALVTAGTTNDTSAAVIKRDWKVPGDGLLTYDDVNQREWLDLSASLLNQFAAPRLENALAQISPNGIFEGFTWASHDDVAALSQSAGINTLSWDFAVNRVATRQLIDLLGITSQRSDYLLTDVSSRGFIKPITPVSELPPVPPGYPPYPPSSDGAYFDVRYLTTTGEGIWAGAAIGHGDDVFEMGGDRFPNHVGLMLFQNVPEPAALTLVIAGDCAFGCMRRQISARHA